MSDREEKQGSTARRPSPWTLEIVVVSSLFSVAVLVGHSFVKASRAAGHQPFFYQHYFEPAVMMACGRGFAVASPAPVPALQSFLNQAVDTFSCDAIPAGQPVRSEGIFQWSMSYLMLLVAAVWRVLGISWSGLAPLYGVLFGCVIVLAYGIFRCAMGRVLAILCSAALTVSTLHLVNLPHLRDYAKAPFVMAHILILAWFVTRQPRRWQLLTLAATYGAILGVGYGVRPDVLANIPPFLVTLAFLPGGVWKNLGLKLAMACVCAAVFITAAWPALRQVVAGSGWGCQFHVVLLGLDVDFTDELGVASTFYQWNSRYSDELIYTAVSSHHNRMHAPKLLEFCRVDYDVASAAYLRDIVIRFPGDMATRAYASAWRVLDLPFPWYDAPLPGMARWIYRPRGALLKPLAGTARLASLVAIALLGVYSMRLGLFALLFVLYFGGYPALQFANRHYFQLEFIGWWAMAFVFCQGLKAIRSRIGERVPPTPAGWSSLAVHAARFAVIATLIVVVPLPILRAYQRRQVDRLTGHLLEAPRVKVPMVPTNDGHELRLADAIEGLDDDPMRTAYLDIHIDLARCPGGVPLALRYDPAYPAFNFSGLVRTMPLDAVPERVLLPVYRYFQGLDLGGAPVRCVTRVERLASVRELQLLPVLTLPRGWRALPFYQVLKPIELWPRLLGPRANTGP